VPFGGRIPGSYQYFIKGQQAHTGSFNSGGSYTETVVEGSIAKTAKKGERGIEYGCNLYKSGGPNATDVQGGLGSAALTGADSSTGYPHSESTR
jgi:hypothetical protein